MLPFFGILHKAPQFKWTPKCERVFIQLKEYLSKASLLSKPQPGEDLYVYLAASNAAVSLVLIREDQRAQLLVYYVSHSLLLVETKYLDLEKLALALLVPSCKL